MCVEERSRTISYALSADMDWASERPSVVTIRDHKLFRVDHRSDLVRESVFSVANREPQRRQRKSSRMSTRGKPSSTESVSAA